MNEQLDEYDVRNLDYTKKVDIVISHTCPTEFDVGMGHHESKYRDPSRLGLSYILHKHRPDLWYFGHWHHHMTGFYHGCRWVGMGRFDKPGCNGWEVLKEA